MAGMELKVVGLNQLIAKLGKATAQKTLEQPLLQGALLLQRWSQDKRLTGPRPKYLGVNTGRLRSSLAISRSIKKDEYEFKIGTNVIYARIHEFGGVIRPKNKKFLAWQGRDKKWVFTRKPVTIPARPFLGPAIKDQGNREKILSLVTKSINEALNKNDAG